MDDLALMIGRLVLYYIDVCIFLSPFALLGNFIDKRRG